LDDYYDKFYIKEAKRFKELSANDNRLAKDIALWKETVAERWDSIHVVDKDTQVLETGGETGVKYTVKYVIDEQGLDDAVGLELVTLKPASDPSDHEIYSVHQFKVIGHEGNNYTFETEVEPDKAGSFRTCVRMYPKNKNLPHRQDFCYVKWLD
jgi:starch phosphorylase